MTDRPIREEVAAMLARAEAAPNGPWEVNRFDNNGGDINWQVAVGHHPQGFFNCSDLDRPGMRDAATFIAHAREDLPRLARDWERQAALLDEIRALADQWAEPIEATTYGNTLTEHHARQLRALLTSEPPETP